MLAPLSTRLSAPAIRYSSPIRVRVFVPFRSKVRVSHRNFSSKMSISDDSIAVPSENSVGETQKSDVLIQYVVLRKDLIDSWPLGSIITQGCHASVSAIWSHKDDAHTVDYCSPEKIDSMHKVTLEVKGEPQILNLSQKLTANGIAHKLWIEQPENIPTCLATKPYPKSAVSSFFKNLKLCIGNEQICMERMVDKEIKKEESKNVDLIKKEESKKVDPIKKEESKNVDLIEKEESKKVDLIKKEELKNVEEGGKFTLNPASQPPSGSDVGASRIKLKKRKYTRASTNDQANRNMISREIINHYDALGRSLRVVQKSLRNLQKHWPS